VSLRRLIRYAAVLARAWEAPASPPAPRVVTIHGNEPLCWGSPHANRRGFTFDYDRAVRVDRARSVVNGRDEERARRRGVKS